MNRITPIIGNQLKNHRPFVFILIAYLIAASAYSIVTPLFEASDELWHYPTVKYIADHALQLPVQDPNVVTAWRQEGSQPPLYYMIGAVLTGWIDTSDLDTVRRINPHADIGAVVPDFNANMMIHDPAVESFPWKGTALAVHLTRFYSVLLSAITVIMTYLLTLELFPDQRWLALAATIFTAFNPMFLFISGSVNNDNLSNAAASTLLVLIVQMLKRKDAPPMRTLIVIGVVTGVGLLAKLNIGFLIPFIALSLALIAYRLRNWRPFVIGGVVTGGLTILIAGWWYVRNMQLYGDPTGLNVFLQIVGRRVVPPNAAQLWSERHTFMMSYWGFFGGVNVPLPDWVYIIFTAILFGAAVGLLVGLVKWIAGMRTRSVATTSTTTKFNWSIFLGRALTVIWMTVLFVGLIRWTSETWASQGRLMFAAIAPLSMWMAVGLIALWPRIGRILSGISAVWFVGAAVAIALPLNYMAYNVTTNSTYRQLIHSTRDTILTTPDSAPLTVWFREMVPNAEYANLRMTFKPQTVSAAVGSYIDLSAAKFLFTVDHEFSRDWSAFLHLETPDGVIIAQRDVYLRQGLGATSLMKYGENWFNDFAIKIPDFAVAPQKLNLYLGMYDIKTNERLKIDVEPGSNSVKATVTEDNRVLIGTVNLMTRGALLPLPNPMQVNFSDQAELIAYDISDLTVYTGKQITVTLYWRALQPMTTDYNVFAQIFETGTSRVFGAHDGQPAGWTRPTTTWKVGEIIKDEHTFTVGNDAPPGNWSLIVGMYQLRPEQTVAQEKYKRLRIRTSEGGDADDSVPLTRVRIITPPVQPTATP